MKTVLSVLVILSSLTFGALNANATGKVNPKLATWNAPLTNTDQSALIDLAGYNVYISTTATAPGCGSTAWVKMPGVPGSTVTVLAPTPAPIPGTKATWNIVNVPGPAGQKWMTVTAIDTTGSESGCALASPFVMKAPGAPDSLILE